MKRIIPLILISLVTMLGCTQKNNEAELNMTNTTTNTNTNTNTNTKVILNTSKGDIVIQLDNAKAPQSSANFIQYCRDDFYAGTIFHRVISSFMIQGGGLDKDLNEKETKDPVVNEANNGLRNNRGTIAMARTSDPHSATSQFFINVVDNAFLNFSSETSNGWGYAVFGKVVKGMDVVDTIRDAATGNKGHHQDVPTEAITINSCTIE